MENEIPLYNWIRSLPLRWTAGGLLLGIIWTLTSSVLQQSFDHPVGGLVEAFQRVMFIIILPLTILALIWGISERAKLMRSISQEGKDLKTVISRTMSRQIGKAVLCGFTFGIYIQLVFPRGKTLPWNTFERIINNLTPALGYVLLALPIGFAVGYFFKRNLARRLIAHGADL